MPSTCGVVAPPGPAKMAPSPDGTHGDLKRQDRADALRGLSTKVLCVPSALQDVNARGSSVVRDLTSQTRRIFAVSRGKANFGSRNHNRVGLPLLPIAGAATRQV